MTPKQKAKELVESMIFSKMSSINWDTGELEPMPMNEYYKQCALKAVDEILNIPNIEGSSNGHMVDEGYAKVYWQKVKTEIENL